LAALTILAALVNTHSLLSLSKLRPLPLRKAVAQHKSLVFAGAGNGNVSTEDDGFRAFGEAEALAALA
jgi:hypothetical protein